MACEAWYNGEKHELAWWLSRAARYGVFTFNVVFNFGINFAV